MSFGSKFGYCLTVIINLSQNIFFTLALRMKKCLLIFLVLITTNTNFGQIQNFGMSGGLSFSFGNKVNRIGLRGAVFYTYGFAQINATVNSYYNFQTLALKKKTPEIQLGIGTQLGFGKKDSITNRFVTLTENNTGYFYSAGYSFMYFFDKQNTSQGGGIMNVNIENFTFATANDLFGFGKGWRDRFRTAAVLFQYRYLDTKFGINSTLWTGDYIGCVKVKDSDYPARFGYKENDKAIYGNSMASLLSLQVEQLLPYTQVARVNIGIDSEYVRHTLQNKLIHDQYFIPERIIKRPQMHFPMLDKDGNQFLFKEGQKVRPASFYFNLGMNNGLFY